MSHASSRSTDNRARPRIRRRYLSLATILLGVLLIAGWGISVMTSPERLNRVLVDLLEQSIGCQASIGRVSLSWDGMLIVDGIELTVPGAEGELEKLMTTDRMTVQLKLWPLLIGRVRAASVALTNPTLYLTEDPTNQRFNYHMLLSQPTDEKSDSALPRALPEVYLNGGLVHFGQWIDSAYQRVQSLRFDGTLSADPDQSGAYDFVLTQRAGVISAEAETQVHGRIDLRQPSIEMQLDRFSFAGPYRYLLPQDVRHWWDRMSPSGTLPRVVFSARGDEEAGVLMSALMQFEGISLRVPLTDAEPLSVADVTGEVRLAGWSMTFDNVVGEVEGIRFRAEGRIDGISTIAPYSISVTTDPFDLPENAGLWDKLPPQVTQYRDRFAPHGRYQVALTIGRPVQDAPIEIRGHLDLLESYFCYHKFPYPVQSLTGRIFFNRDRIQFDDLAAVSPTGVTGIVSGTVGPPLKHGVVDITIRGREVPVDEHLFNAMKPKHREVMDLFFSQDGYESLLRAGVIQSPDDPGQEELVDANPVRQVTTRTIPRFKPGGSAGVTVHIRRPAGSDQRYAVTTELDVAGLSSVFDFWPYPLTAQSGRVVIRPDNVEVDHVYLRAPNGGGGVVHGLLELPRDDRPLIPHLQLTSIYLPVDPILIASIPPPKDHWVRMLNLTGELVGTGEIYVDSHGKVAFTVDTNLRNGTAKPNDGQYVLDQINGGVTIERTRILLDEVVAHREYGEIKVNGLADYGGEGLDISLLFEADDLPLERGLIDLLPHEHQGRTLLAQLNDTYRPDGRFDARLSYSHPRGQPEHFDLTVAPHEFGFDYAGQRIELTDLTGRVDLTPSQAVLHEVSGRFAAGTFTLEGQVHLGDNPGLALGFDVHAQRIDPVGRALMPAGVRRLIDGLSLQGAYTIEHARLITSPNNQQGPTHIFEGTARFSGATAQLGVPITELDAEMNMHIAAFADQPWPHIDIRIQADRLRAADRLVRRLSLGVLTGSQPNLVNITNLRGVVYGGALVGHGQLGMGENPLLGFQMTLHDVMLEPFLDPLGQQAEVEAISDQPADVETPRDMSTGLLSASLSIRVPLNDPQNRQGRGVVTIRDAKLYDRPLTLALLQAANLAIPQQSSFDRASARYVIFGNHVVFDHISFDSPVFAITGTGTMEYPSTHLNLNMVTRNLTAPNLGPVTDLVKTFKNSLLGIQVTGTLAKPEARVVPLEGLFRSWDRVFGTGRVPLTTEYPVQ